MAGKGGLALSEERRAKIFQWLDVNGANDPTAEAAFRKSLYNLGVQQFRLIKREWKNQKVFQDTQDKKHAYMRSTIKRILGPTLDPGNNIIIEPKSNMYEDDSPKTTARRGRKRGKVEIPEPIDEDVDTYLKKMDMEIARALVQNCLRGNSNSLKLYQQIQGRLVEKTEKKVTVSFDSNTIAQLMRDTRRDLESQGMVIMPAKPGVLLPEVCETPGQSSNSDC